MSFWQGDLWINEVGLVIEAPVQSKEMRCSSGCAIDEQYLIFDVIVDTSSTGIRRMVTVHPIIALPILYLSVPLSKNGQPSARNTVLG